MPNIEEDVYQSEFWNDPVYPPNHQFGGLQWEAVQRAFVEESTEVGSVHRKPKFQEDFEEGFV